MEERGKSRLGREVRAKDRQNGTKKMAERRKAGRRSDQPAKTRGERCGCWRPWSSTNVTAVGGRRPLLALVAMAQRARTLFQFSLVC